MSALVYLRWLAINFLELQRHDILGSKSKILASEQRHMQNLFCWLQCKTRTMLRHLLKQFEQCRGVKDKLGKGDLSFLLYGPNGI